MDERIYRDDTGRLLELLEESIRLLNRHGVTHWARCLERDRGLIENGDRYGVEHLLTTFGGMGSFGDLQISRANGHSISPADEAAVNARLGALRGELYDLATAILRAADPG